ncbi:MAG TPA: nuclear transport factor 2 family protein [Solirubrobacteraceae bacterium]|nr:nuclear transport factor 2 family protein [Solirubrobacteraceae bacterium]
MADSPIAQLLSAIDALDVDAAIALMAPDCTMLAADGRRALGTRDVRELLTDFVDQLRSSTHRITAQWDVDDVWIAEVESDYEFEDWGKLNDVPRAFFVRVGGDGIQDARVYGAHEQGLEHRDPEAGGIYVGGRWMPPM